MAELANRWMDTVFGVSEFCYPKVWTIPSISLKTRKLAALLRSAGCTRLVAVNLGVGTNPRKRLSLDFEQDLLRAILKDPQTVVLLDKGFGQDELSRSAALLDGIKNQGFSTADMSFDDPEYPSFSHGLLTIECTIGEIAALIAQCDEFIGYDSACQHIAAAVQTPAVTIFAGSNDMHFVRRWSACGKAQHKIVHVDTLTDPQNVDANEVVSRIMAERPKTEERRQKPALSEKSLRVSRVEGSKGQKLEFRIPT
jgi:ADP-heptose:LPS heptosyltransferase